MTLLYEKIYTFRKTNETLVKRRRTKKIRIRTGDVLTIENVHSLIKQKEIVRPQLSRRSMEESVM